MDAWERMVKIFNRVMLTTYSPEVRNIMKAEVGQWDSLRVIELSVELQKEFGVRFDTNHIISASSLRNFYEVIERSFDKSDES